MVNLNVESEQLRETAAPRAGHIEIPLALRHHRVSLLPISSRLSGVFKRANIRILGDLHGRSQHDFALHRNCGLKTMKELEALIHVARQCDEKSLFGAGAIPFQSAVFSIPSARANLRFVDLPISKRLDRAVHKIGIDRLGDLGGRSAIQLQQYPGVGPSRVAEMQQLVMRATAGEFEDLVVHVPSSVTNLRFADLPISKRARGLIRKLRIERLGELNGRSSAEFLGYPGIGQRTVAEIRHLVVRAAAGEFTSLEIDESEKVPELIRLIEISIGRLHRADRQIFLEKIGDEDRPPLSFRGLGRKQGVTGEAIRQTIEKIVLALRKTWGPRIPFLLNVIRDRCTSAVCPLTPELLCSWLAGRDVRFSLSLRTHVRIISELDKRIPAWPTDYQLGETLKKKNRDFVRHVAEILRSADGPLSFAQVFSELTSRPKYSHWSVQTFLRTLGRIGSVGVDCAAPQMPVLHLIAK